MTILDRVPTLIGNAFSKIFYDAVLERDGPTTGESYDPVPGTPVTYACKAIVETYSDYFRAQGLVNANERKVLILATSIGTRPAPQDRVTIQGIKFAILEVGTDPARAVWVCKGRM